MLQVYIEDSSDTLPPLTGLEEFTAYSVQVAVFDENKTMCVFSQGITAWTGTIVTISKIDASLLPQIN